MASARQSLHREWYTYQSLRWILQISTLTYPAMFVFVSVWMSRTEFLGCTLLCRCGVWMAMLVRLLATRRSQWGLSLEVRIGTIRLFPPGDIQGDFICPKEPTQMWQNNINYGNLLLFYRTTEISSEAIDMYRGNDDDDRPRYHTSSPRDRTTRRSDVSSSFGVIPAQQWTKRPA